jgi:tetratricopeptide (TPR) repeat protein
MRIAGLLFLLLLVCFGSSRAEQPVSVRVGEHPGFGRMVFDFGEPVQVEMERDGTLVTLHIATTRPIGPVPGRPRNVLDVAAGTGEVRLTLVAGARIRIMHIGDRLVVDALDPVRAEPPPTRAVQAALPLDRHDLAPPSLPTAPFLAAPTAIQPAAAPPVQPVASPPPASAAPPAPAPSPVSAPPPATNNAPPALASTRVPLPPGVDGAAILLPFDPTTGAAAFRRGSQAVLVFDQPRPLDLASLHDDPVFGQAVVHVLADATVVEFPLSDGGQLGLQHSPDGWRIAVTSASSAPHPISISERQERLEFAADEPGRAVTIIDPRSGDMLLVGTQRKPGQAVTVGYDTPQFVLLPTWQGVVIEPLSDRLTMETTPHGFALGGTGIALATSTIGGNDAAAGQAAHLTRRFEFPAMPVAALAERMRQQIVAAADAPPLARGPRQRAVAQTMIALGMGEEAAAVLHVAASENPTEAEIPDHKALAAIAALIAGRPEQADEINDPALAGTDEMTLWRAVRRAELRSSMPEAAAGFAATWPLILTYGPALRDRLLPLAAETMIAAGEAAAAESLLAARPDDPVLTLARGMLAQANGETDAALQLYDALTVGKDRLVRIRAARRAVELRLSTGRINTGQAADALDALLFAWRGDQRELDLRERLAELRAEQGRWADAINLLRTSIDEFPDQQDAIQAKMKTVFAGFLADPRAKAMSPLDFVSLVDANTDLLPSGPAGEDLQSRLADRLLALDLPDQAERLLDKLTHTAPSGVARAGFGARLATLRLRQGDAAGALAALSASATADLPAGLSESRTLTMAEAEARSGDVAGAVSALSAMGTAAADEARASILERAQDWPGAETALKDYVAKAVPASGTLDDTQRRTLLRLATAAARVGDDGVLGTLRTQDLPRMGSGPLLNMFQLLTSDPVHGPADLRRSGQEAVLAHALPEDLKAIR